MSLSRLLGLLSVMEMQLLEEEPQGAGTAPPLLAEVNMVPRSTLRSILEYPKQTADKFIQVSNMWAPFSPFSLVSSQVGFPPSQACL